VDVLTGGTGFDGSGVMSMEALSIAYRTNSTGVERGVRKVSASCAFAPKYGGGRDETSPQGRRSAVTAPDELLREPVQSVVPKANQATSTGLRDSTRNVAVSAPWP
jgi:hypothetical protein